MSPVKRPRNLWSCLLVFALPAMAADDLDEVVVQADRHQLQTLREEMVRLEDDFFGRFNELNKDRQFDFFCTDTARTGTQIRQKVCRPRFANEAMGDEGRTWLDGYRSNSVGGASTPARVVIDIKEEQLRRLMLDLLGKDPQLLGTLVRYGDLKSKYANLLKGRDQPSTAAPTAESR
jgi:hypothetical protein